MTRVLKSERRAPLSGDVRSIVVFLHGYGAVSYTHLTLPTICSV